jgi:hypothetical protein
MELQIAFKAEVNLQGMQTFELQNMVLRIEDELRRRKEERYKHANKDMLATIAFGMKKDTWLIKVFREICWKEHFGLVGSFSEYIPTLDQVNKITYAQFSQYNNMGRMRWNKVNVVLENNGFDRTFMDYDKVK